MTTTWLEELKESVAWSDLIHSDCIDGIDCCWYSVNGVRHYFVPGSIRDIYAACRDAVIVKAKTGCCSAVLFIDEQATVAQVEDAMHTTAGDGVGCQFLEPAAKAAWLALLDRWTEARLMKDFILDHGGTLPLA